MLHPAAQCLQREFPWNWKFLEPPGRNPTKSFHSSDVSIRPTGLGVWDSWGLVTAGMKKAREPTFFFFPKALQSDREADSDEERIETEKYNMSVDIHSLSPVI